jgi:hypothetical protein
MSISPIRDLMAQVDIENTDSKRENISLAALGKNSLHAVLEGLNTIPVVSVGSGVTSIVLGLGETGLTFLAGILGLITGYNPSHPNKALGSGMKLAALGAAAVFMPVTGQVLNGVAAAKDVADVINYLGS